MTALNFDYTFEVLTTDAGGDRSVYHATVAAESRESAWTMVLAAFASGDVTRVTVGKAWLIATTDPAVLGEG